MTDEEYKAQLVGEARAAVAAAEAKVTKAEAHLDGALAAVKAAEAELARVEATDYVWVEPTEHVIVRAG